MRKILLFSLIFLFFAITEINANHERIPRQNNNCPSLETLQNRQGFRTEYYSVQSTVKTRFSCTKVFSDIRNTGNASKELCFIITLPEKAFISGLCMEVDGKKYRGVIKEKQVARVEYNNAIQSSVTVALVESVK